MELGLYTFGEATRDPATGRTVSPAERLRDLVEEAVLAEQVGLDVFGVGEHHRPDFVVATPAVVLAAIAARTTRIRLTSAATVLGSDDPVRVFQEFATLDLMSGGRAEIMAGRGSFIESFPLFGFDLSDYDTLFAEKLDLLLLLRRSERVTWTGRHRAALVDQPVYPRPLQNPLPVWVAVGGTPPSVARAGRLGLPIALAVIGGEPAHFAPLFALHREHARRAGHDPATIPASLNRHAFLAADSQDAADLFYGPYAAMMTQIGHERGWPPMTRTAYDIMRAPGGSLAVGSPQQVIDKLLAEHALFGHQRILLQMSVGTMPHADLMRAIELFGTEVAPVVRREVASRLAKAGAPGVAAPGEGA